MYQYTMPAVTHQTTTTVELTEDEVHKALTEAAQVKAANVTHRPFYGKGCTVSISHHENGTTRVRFTTENPTPQKAYPAGPLPGGATPRVNPGRKATYSGPGCADCKGVDMSRGGEGPGCSTCARARGRR